MSDAPAPGQALGTVTVTAGDPTREKTNPYFREAIALKAAGDSAGLRELGARVCDMGYAADGQVRLFIAEAVQALETESQ